MEPFTAPTFTKEKPDFTQEANRKFDQGKTRYDLIPAGPLEELAKVYTMGAAKYADNGWREGIKWSRVFAAIMRHLWAFWRGEDRDPESGHSHLAHAAWGCFTLIEYSRNRASLDDRYREANPLPVGAVIPLLNPTSDLSERLRVALTKKQREDEAKEGVWISTEPLGLPGKAWIPKDEVPYLVKLILQAGQGAKTNAQ